MKLTEPTKYLGHTAAGVKNVLIQKQFFEGNVKKKNEVSLCIIQFKFLEFQFTGHSFGTYANCSEKLTFLTP